MVKRIKKKTRVKRSKRHEPPAWLVGFNAENNAGIYIHKHGDSDDHSNCGPVVLCCDKAIPAYQTLAPDLVDRVENWERQSASHLSSWFDNGLQAMYFVLCDHDEPDRVCFQFGLPEAPARELLMGRVGTDIYRRPGSRVEVEA